MGAAGITGVVTVRPYGSLRDFLPPGRRGLEISVRTDGRAPVRHIAGAAGIPFPEIEAVLLDGEPAGLDAVPAPGSRLALYPSSVHGLLPACPALRPPLGRPPSFILEAGLGGLARILRLLGFHADYRPDGDPALLVEKASSSGSVLLSRDRGLLMRRGVVHGRWVRSGDPREQAIEVAVSLGLAPEIRLFRFCSKCGGEIDCVPKIEIDHLLEPLTREHYDEFWRCRRCGRIYWAGSHLPALKSLLEGISAACRTALTPEPSME
ncbi:hypothetical protein GX411_07245 [Candidatus Fermentibacteria bacterium]|nr:hypothetical protein [Candidatus Fermentibacteria bacterium]